jgi:CubicO group peptidase (beta-lactamase class C family)
MAQNIVRTLFFAAMIPMRPRALLLVAGVLSACVQPPPARHFPSAPELTALLEARAKDRRAVGIAVGVVEADGSSTVAFAGDAGAGARTLGRRSGFEIGSITKTFTAILLADMVRTGKVRYDDPVSRYLPDSVRVPSRDGREITLLDLATHHSGLPGMPDNMSPADPNNYLADYSAAQMYAFLSGVQPGDDSYQYSNIGFGLLGHALARAANTPYEELVRERILKPLGMNGTAIELRDGPGEWMVKGHNKRGFAVPLWDLPTIAGAGALRSNLDDMMRFLAANLRAPASGLERSMRATHRMQRPVADSTFLRLGHDAIGMGWQIRAVGDSRIVWKDGGTAGFQTFIGFDPGRRVGVVVLSNTAIEVDDIGFHLIDPKLPLGAPAPIPPRIDVPVSLLRQYAGEYYIGPDFSLGISVEGGQLFARWDGKAQVPLYAESENRFVLDVASARVSFVRDEAGAVNGLVFEQGGSEMRGRRVR